MARSNTKLKPTLLANAPMTQANEKAAPPIVAPPAAPCHASEAEAPLGGQGERSPGFEESSEVLPPPPKAATFDSFYLQAVTREFADDIDKVRNSSDFKDSSLPILIEALRQGVGIYGEEERERVMGRGK